MPASRSIEADGKEDEIGDLVADKQSCEPVFIFHIGLTKTEKALHISKHFFNPETLLIPDHSLWRSSVIISHPRANRLEYEPARQR